MGEIGPVEEHNDRHLYTSVVLALSDDGRDCPGEVFDGGETYPEQVSGPASFHPPPHGFV
jgi:hypothetical protein